jgi:hypothetical protein
MDDEEVVADCSIVPGQGGRNPMGKRQVRQPADALGAEFFQHPGAMRGEAVFVFARGGFGRRPAEEGIGVTLDDDGAQAPHAVYHLGRPRPRPSQITCYNDLVKRALLSHIGNDGFQRFQITVEVGK